MQVLEKIKNKLNFMQNKLFIKNKKLNQILIKNYIYKFITDIAKK